MKWLIIAGLVVGLLLLFAQWGANLAKQKAALKELLPKIMGEDWMAGINIVNRLRRDGFQISGPQFYCFMSDLHDEGLLEVEDKLKIIRAEDMRDSIGTRKQKIKVINFRTTEVEVKVRWFRLSKTATTNE